MVNLLVLTPYYPDNENKISGDTFVKSQVDYLANHFKNIYVISPLPYMPKFLSKFKYIQRRFRNSQNIDNYRYRNIKVYYPKFFYLPGTILKKKLGTLQLNTIKNLIEKENIKAELIQTHFAELSKNVAPELKKKLNAKLIVTIHGTHVWKYTQNNLTNIADELITVSQSNYDALKKLNIKKEIKIVSNTFNDKLFYTMDKNKCRKKLNLEKNKKIIITIGNLVEVKNQISLIKSIQNIKKTIKDIELLIVGDGILRKDLEEYINKNNLKKNVKLIGQIPNQELKYWLNASDLFVLPSHTESFGVVQIEALGCGIPVLASSNGGSQEIINDNKIGEIYGEPTNIKKLSKNIIKLLNKEWDKDYIVNFSKKYTCDNQNEKLLKIINNTLEDS